MVKHPDDIAWLGRNSERTKGSTTHTAAVVETTGFCQRLGTRSGGRVEGLRIGTVDKACFWCPSGRGYTW